MYHPLETGRCCSESLVNCKASALIMSLTKLSTVCCEGTQIFLAANALYLDGCVFLPCGFNYIALFDCLVQISEGVDEATFVALCIYIGICWLQCDKWTVGIHAC